MTLSGGRQRRPPALSGRQRAPDILSAARTALQSGWHARVPTSNRDCGQRRTVGPVSSCGKEKLVGQTLMRLARERPPWGAAVRQATRRRGGPAADGGLPVRVRVVDALTSGCASCPGLPATFAPSCTCYCCGAAPQSPERVMPVQEPCPSRYNVASAHAAVPVRGPGRQPHEIPCAPDPSGRTRSGRMSAPAPVEDTVLAGAARGAGGCRKPRPPGPC